MLYDSFRPQRHTIRLRDYDYATPGAYFVTLCTHQRQCLLSEVKDASVSLSIIGTTVAEQWLDLALRFSSVTLDAFVVMPNHVYGILMLQEPEHRHDTVEDSTPTLGRVLLTFKSITARLVQPLLIGEDRRLWQRNYYEKIIRNGRMLDATRMYIERNPANWENDAENPKKALCCD